jgi:hypothetical protein
MVGLESTRDIYPFALEPAVDEIGNPFSVLETGNNV